MTGTGKVTYDDVNVNNAPYYASLAAETKYWWLSGFQTQQFPTGPLSLVSSRPRLTDWIISMVLRVEAPDKTRATMLAGWIAMASLFNPMKGFKTLIFDEFPNSYFMAEVQKADPTNEAQVPYMVDFDIEMACTGPAYAVDGTMVPNDITSSNTAFTIPSLGDSIADPIYFIEVTENYNGDVTLSNITSGESLTWNGSLAVGDVLIINLNPDFGQTHEVTKNGSLAMASLIGPAWPHILPGANSMILTGPTAGVITTEWRDRFLVGKQ